ncbi:MAG: rep/recomb RecO protein [Patescibacteria group bacterium]|nr:rep/recomb RecO protein [Patescibacteria group bacterium]
MSIEKYTCEALVLSEYNIAESDAILLLYTRDFGVINAKQSSLKKSSKLRQHLLVGRYCDVTLVKGREIYRIAGARESLRKANRDLIPHVSGLAKRFLGFENKNIKLYDRIREYGCRNDLDTNSVRLCMMADILTVGGYLDISKLDMTLEEYKISSIDDMYMKVALLRDLAVKNIRDAVEASML